MAQRLDQVVIIDIESTCWEGEPPPGQEAEIIEVGVCTLDVASGGRLERESILVRPTASTVSPFCTALTTLTQGQVEAGIPFADACALLRERYLTQKRAWASYGDYDRRQFERQCAGRGVAYPFGPGHLNVKTLFALTHSLPREIGLAEALKMLDMPLEGTHHRGGDDAWNIALILSLLLSRIRRT